MNRLIAWVLLCFALTWLWWNGVAWARDNGELSFVSAYLGDSTDEALRFGAPVVINLFVAAVAGLFGSLTNPLGKFAIVLWAAASPYCEYLVLTRIGCTVSGLVGGHGGCF
jgi:hypothetical protein